MNFAHKDYTVAWICALPLEMAAAKIMLDETHSPLSLPRTDHNTYTLGRLGCHNVVIACLPSGVYGTTSASVVLSHMLATFSSIQFGLMVGIAGGIPSETTDIRLGDVVVSMPTKDSGGVIPYNIGKILCGGHFQRTGSLNKPPQYLLTAASQMRSDCMIRKFNLEKIISNKLQENPELQKQFTRPSQDLLFSSTYDHQSSNTDCTMCDQQQLINRVPRATSEPQIYYGSVASVNQVIKDAKSRDRISKDSGSLCIEMEAAGLMDQLPFLVIRGISDYCDTHKSKDWQNYAALSAASYTKELLGLVSCRSIASDARSLTKDERNHLQFPGAITLPHKTASTLNSTIHSNSQHRPSNVISIIPKYSTRAIYNDGDPLEKVSGTRSCDKVCLCDCHKKHRIQFPTSRRGVIGTLFLRYQGALFFRRRCNYDTCKNNNFGPLEAIYCSPKWLIDVTFILSGSPSYGLFIPRRLGWGSAETILKSAYEGNIEGIKVLLSNAVNALHDIDQKHGRTALHVSSISCD